MLAAQTLARQAGPATSFVFDLDDGDDLITPAEATKHPVLRRGPNRPCRLSKIYRLFSVGVRGVRLQSFRTASGLMTSRSAIARFINDLNADAGNIRVTSTSRRRSNAAVDRELDELLA